MTELVDRMTRLADAAVGDRTLVDPSTGDAADPTPRRSLRPWLAAAALVLVAIAVVVATGARDDADGRVRAGPGTAETAPAPVLSVVLPTSGAETGLPTLQVRGPDGAVGALRSVSEVVESPDEGGEVGARGLITHLPAAGRYEVDISWSGIRIACPVEVAPGDRVIIALLTEEGPPACGPVQTVAEWAGASGLVGRRYVGLTEEEAEEAAAADGYTTRVVGRDGVSFDVTADLQPARVDLRAFDGIVVSAALGGEPHTVEPSEPPGAGEPLAVVVMSIDPPLPGSGEVTVEAGGRAVVRSWPGPSDESGPTGGTLFPDLPAGPAEIEVAGEGACLQDVDLDPSGTVVTLLVPGDGRLPDGGRCGAGVETLEEHLARVTAGFDRHEPEEAYIGLSEEEAQARAAADGYQVRVLARDGRPFGRDDDLRTDRVNLVVFDDEVRAAALF